MLDVAGGMAVGTYAGHQSGTAAPADGLIVSGKVGIGTPAPAASAMAHVFQSGGGYPLKVESSGSTTGIELANSAGSNLARIGMGISGEFFVDGGADSIKDLVVTSSGQVGIGTTTPVASLHVNGGVKIGNSGGPPIQEVINMNAQTCSAWSPTTISSGTAGSCTLSVSGLNVGDNVALNCQPAGGTPLPPSLVSCQISATNQVRINVYNFGGGGLTPPANWHVTVIRF
jgi:hypothetical protein